MSPPASVGIESPQTELAKGTFIWFHDEQVVWKPGTIQGSTETHYTIEIRSGEENITLPKTHPICLRNKDQFTDAGLVVHDDLTQLTHLNEPSVLHSLQVRFDTDKIYTFTGPILISMNPFKRLPGMYDDETLEEFIKTKSTTKPHVFATSNAAFKGICERGNCQTVLISGESGAGKTVSTKFVMKYLACAGSGEGERTEIEKQVLESNPLLEGFGNARTLRNDNSSRFGKFIELQFKAPEGRVMAAGARLCGARIHTYLLEKVRVTDQQEGERNYHIFYQCCAASAAYASPEGVYDFPQVNTKYKGPSLKLDLRGFADHAKFSYVTKSACIALNNIDDLVEFETTIAAMRTVGLSFEEINAIMNCVASCLLLGNTKFLAVSGEGSKVDTSSPDKSFALVCDLLGVKSEQLETALTTKTIVTRDETFVSPVLPNQASDFRDALARQLFGLVFLRLVDRANMSIGYLANVSLYCGVLDIFGFECFKINSFEQLCINFTNERLQQFFNDFVFKLEEQLYKAEDIPWDPLDFPDNSESVDLLGDPKTGLFAMLDEECIVPQGNDKGFCNKIIAKHGNGASKRFDIIKTKPDWFVVRHFAGPVPYASEAFLDKNKDKLPDPIYEAMKASSKEFIANLFLEFEARRNGEAAGTAAATKKNAVEGPSAADASAGKKRKLVTVANEFKDQLQSLMDSVNKTEPHFIRCIKPNSQNLPDIYDRSSVTEQLRYGGVLQAVQVSRAGFPIRVNHLDVWLDYRYCIEGRNVRDALDKINDARARALEMMKLLETDLKIPRHGVNQTVSWAVGRTLVFMKHPAFERLQAARQRRRGTAATTFQARYRMVVARRWYRQAKASIMRIQSLFRGKLARMEAARRRRAMGAAITQAGMRMTLTRDRFYAIRECAIKIQATYKGMVARKKKTRLLVERAANRIKAAWKGHLCRRAYKLIIAGILQTQRSWRMRLAKQQLRRLKQEAKEVGNLLAKYQETQSNLQELQRRSEDMEATKVHLSNERSALGKRIETLEEEIKQLKAETDALSKFKTEALQLRARVVELESNAPIPLPPLKEPSEEDDLDLVAEVGERVIMAMSQVVDSGAPASIPPLPVYTPQPVVVASPAPAAVASPSSVQEAPRPALAGAITPGGVSGTGSAVSQALDQFKNWLGVPRLNSQRSGVGSHTGVLLSSLKGTKSMKAACKDSEATSELRPVQELQDGESAVTCIAFGQEKIHRSYILLAAASKDGTVVVYRCYRTEVERYSVNEAEFPKEDPSASVQNPSDYGNIVVHCRLTGHTRAITSLFFSLLEDMIVTTSIDKSVRFWNADTGEMLKVFTDSSPVPVACFLPFNPSVFVAANSNAVLRLVNATNGTVLQKLKVEAEVRALKFDDTGLFLMAGTKNGSIHVLEACDNSTLRFKFKLQLSRGGITCIAFVSAQNSQPPCLLVNSSDSSVTIVDCMYGAPGNVLINLNVRHRVKVAHSLLPLKCCFSPSDNGYLISGSEDKGVYVFSLSKASNYKMQLLQHHQVPVVAVASNLQDTLLASADSLGRIVLWRRLDFTHLGGGVTYQPTSAVM